MRYTWVFFALALGGCIDEGADSPGSAWLPEAGTHDRADGAAPPGAADRYARLCAHCHGPVGEGGSGPALTGLGDRDRAALIDRIDRTMPSSDPARCVDDCAEAMADLILGVFAADPEDCLDTGATPRRLRLLTRREYANSLRDLFFADAAGGCGGHIFRYTPDGRQPRTVHVAGSFNGWPGTIAEGGWPMIAEGASWVLTRELPPGRHSYKFVIDEQDWLPDPDNPDTEDDGFGGQNSVVEVAPCAPVPDLVAGMPPETRPEGFAFVGHAASGRVTAVHLEAYLDRASVVAEAALARPDGWMPCAVGGAGCPQQFAAEVGARVFRRPLTPEEVTRYAMLATERGFAVALTAMLVSPHFLYRAELGAPVEGGFRLTGHEMATALSYLLWGTTPDDALRAAAAAGELDTSAGVAARARAMLADPRAADTVERFALQWLGIESLSTLPKAAELEAVFGPEVRAAALEETRRFVRHVVFSPEEGRFPALLAAPYTFAEAPLVQLYGLDGVGRVDLPDGRAGLLGHASLLATYAHSDQTSPIRRGLFVRRQLLCQELPPPPPNAGGVPDVDPAATTRERFRQHTADPFCASCHQYIDAVGFGFERFDAVGRFRLEENGQPVAPDGDMNDVEGLGAGTQAPYTDLTTLGGVLARSEAAPACFATQLRRFALGRVEGAGDGCALAGLHAAFADSGYDLEGLLVDLVSRPDFAHRVEAQ